MANTQLNLIDLPFCQRCSLCEERTQVVRGVGPVGKLMIVGEAPGRDEDLSGKPFVGAAGRVLDALLAKANLARTDVYVTNAVKCRPPENALPHLADIKTCHDWLALEIAQVKPYAVILLGATALKSMGVAEKITVCHGTAFEHNGQRVVPMFHPAAALHNHALLPVLEIDWAKLPHILSARTPQWMELVPPSREVVALDTETRSLEDKTLVCLSWASSVYSYGVMFPGKMVPPAVRSDTHRILVGHNLKYDLEVLVANHLPDISKRTLEDTAILAYLLREPSMGLKDLVLGHFGVKLPDAGDLLQDVDDKQARAALEAVAIPTKTFDKLMKEEHPAKAWRRRKTLPALPEPTMDMVPRDILKKYALSDAGWTLALWHKLRPMLPSEMERLYSIEMRLVPVLADMEMQGITIDVKQTQALQKQFESQLAILGTTLRGFGLDNPRSVMQKRKLLEKVLLALAPVKHTPKGEVSVGRKQLERLTKTALVTALLQYGEVEKLRQFCEELLRFQKEGMIHTNYNQMVTETGRLSSSKPNLQNIPVRTEQGKLIRKLFVARPGCSFVSADMSQIELRILADYSHDPTMLKAFAENRSLHLETMFALWPELRALEKPEEHILYKAAKNTNFCKVYGGGPAKIAETAGIPLAQAVAISDTYDKLFPKIAEYQRRQHALARTNGYVETLFHRRRYCPDITSSDHERRSAAEREAANMPIQGTAADMLKEAMVEIANDLPRDAHMLLQVHDELIVECPDKEVGYVKLVLKRAMEQQRGLAVPIKVSLATGKNWGELIMEKENNG